MPEPIKILFLAANPHDISPLRLDEESRAIDVALRQADFRNEFELEQQWSVRANDLQGLLLRHQPDIVHFSGHGSPSAEIVLQDEEGNSQPVSSSTLKGLFALFKANIRCVVLNACYSEQQARAIAEEIDCVIGMSDEIDDTSALLFAAAFYQGLGYGKDIKTAFDLGCLQIDLENLGEQNTPQLLAYKIDPAKVIFVAASPTPEHGASSAFENNLANARHKRKNAQLWTILLTALAAVSVALIVYMLSTRVNNPAPVGALNALPIETNPPLSTAHSGTDKVMDEPVSTPTTAVPMVTPTSLPTPTPSLTVEESAQRLLSAVANQDLDQTMLFICAAQQIKLSTADSWRAAFAELAKIDKLAEERYEWEISGLRTDTLLQRDTQAELRVSGMMNGSSAQGTTMAFIDPVHWHMVNEAGVWRLCALPIAQFGKIIFVSQQDDKAQIYAMNADGSEQTLLVDDPDRYHSPVWSPDGRKVAFVAGEQGMRGSEIYVMNADGSNRIRLTNNQATNEAPAWSPDSQKIAFISGRFELDSDIYVVNADGTALTRLIDSPSRLINPPKDANGATPPWVVFPPGGWGIYSWSANNQQITFAATRDHDNAQIYVVSIDGSNLRSLTKITTGNYFPAWSPNGQQIAFLQCTPDGVCEIYVMNADGKNLNLLTTDPMVAPTVQGLIWSPDSQKLVFWAQLNDQFDPYLFVINADGTGQTILSTEGDFTQGKYIVWSPNSQQIAFTSGTRTEMTMEIKVIYADGTGLKQLTNNSGVDYPIAWLPP